MTAVRRVADRPSAVASTDDHGYYHLERMPAGRHLMLAVTADSPEVQRPTGFYWHDPEVLERMAAGATRVLLTPGIRLAVTARMIR